VAGNVPFLTTLSGRQVALFWQIILLPNFARAPNFDPSPALESFSCLVGYQSSVIIAAAETMIRAPSSPRDTSKMRQELDKELVRQADLAVLTIQLPGNQAPEYDSLLMFCKVSNRVVQSSHERYQPMLQDSAP